MDALAETWSRSGQRSEDLYKGSTDEIIKELRAWIVDRKARNEANMTLLWDIYTTNDVIFGTKNYKGTLEEMRMAFKAKHVKNVERVKEYEKKREKQTLRAKFLLSTLSDRGIKWKKMPSTPGWTDMDAEVCAFLETRDRTFDAEEQLEILENEKEIAEWRLEQERREADEDVSMLGDDDDADEYDTNPHTDLTATAGSKDRQNVREAFRIHEIAVPVDVTGLLPPPRPRAKDSPESPLSPDTLDAIEEELLETEETAEAIARRIGSVNTTGVQAQVGKKSKAKIRDMRRKKAIARAKGASNAESASRDDVVDKELSDQMAKVAVSSSKDTDE